MIELFKTHIYVTHLCDFIFQIKSFTVYGIRCMIYVFMTYRYKVYLFKTQNM